jgi:transketolase N-terminal domain/subunit
MVEVYVKQVNRSSRSLVMIGQEVHAREGRWWSGMSVFAGYSMTQILTLIKILDYECRQLSSQSQEIMPI